VIGEIYITAVLVLNLPHSWVFQSLERAEMQIGCTVRIRARFGIHLISRVHLGIVPFKTFQTVPRLCDEIKIILYIFLVNTFLKEKETRLDAQFPSGFLSFILRNRHSLLAVP
jgi:hypothetical protein